MKRYTKVRAVLATAVLVALGVACSSTDGTGSLNLVAAGADAAGAETTTTITPSSVPAGCVPGQSAGCVGPGACTGYQVCKADRTFDGCICTGGADGGGPAPAPADSGVDATSPSGGGCVPGQSVGCVSVGACNGYQVCKADHTFDVCLCADAGAVADASADAADASDGAPAPFSPKQLPGLALWLDASVGIIQDPARPGYVWRWLDQSDNHNDAKGDCASTTSTGCLPRIDPLAVNRHDAVICHASAFNVSNAPSLQFGTGDYAMALVLRSVYVSSTLTLFETSPDLSWTQDTSANLKLSHTPSSVTAAFSGGFRAYVARGPSLSLTTPTGTATGPTGTANLSSTTATICRTSNTTADPADGVELAEVVAIKGTLTDGDMNKLLAYFKDKYAIP